MPSHSLSSPRRTKQQTCRPSLSLLAGGACRTNNTLSHPAQQAVPLEGISVNEAVPCMPVESMLRVYEMFRQTRELCVTTQLYGRSQWPRGLG